MSTTLILAPLLAVAERTSYLRTYYDILIKKSKVENIFKGSLDSIQSPSPSHYFNKPFVFKSLLTMLSNVLPNYLN